MKQFARPFRIEGYEPEDIVQEAFLAALEWAEGARFGDDVGTPEQAIYSHFRRLRRGHERHNAKTVQRPWQSDDELYEDDAIARSDENLDALVLLIAARSECENEQDDALLDLLATGAGYRPLCQHLRCNKSAAWKKVSRFRGRLYPRLYEEV